MADNTEPLLVGSCPIHPNQIIAENGSCCACILNQPPTAYKNPPPEGGFLKRPFIKRPFIEITRTKKIETQLGRIADALERILLETYGYHSQPAETDTSGLEPEVTYTDQDEYDIQEIVEAVKEEKEE